MLKKFDSLCVVYNNYDDTVDFCDSLKAMNLKEFSIRCFILDNSTNPYIVDKVSGLSDSYDFVVVLPIGSNIGYFGAFNFFFQSSYFDKNRTVVLCNNDLIFDRGFCKKYIDNIESYPSDVMVICPDVITVDGIHQNPHLLKPLGFFSRLKLDLYFSNYYIASILKFIQKILLPFLPKKDNSYHKSGYTYLGIGACYILDKKFFSSFKKLVYPHFIYGEEAYLSAQVHSVDGRLYYDSQLKVQHKESATFSKLPSRLVYEYGKDGYWTYRNLY